MQKTKARPKQSDRVGSAIFSMSFTQKIFVTVFLLASGVFTNAAQTLRVRADSWMPFNGDPAAAQPGYAVEFLREVFQALDVTIDYQIMPWAEAVKAAEEGEIDAIIGANATEAAKLVIGREPIAEPQFALFVRKNSAWQYHNLRSLAEVKLGAVEGYSYWPSIDTYLKKTSAPQVMLYSGDAPAATAVADLRDGKIDAFVESVLVFVWTVKGTGQKMSDYRTAYSEPAEALYVAFAKNKTGEGFARQFDEGLRRLKANGRFQAILDSYGFTKK
jgi:polar amino acid transport system substrate-binding protein